MRSAVIVFPGSNCDKDVAEAIEYMDLGPVEMVWHDDSELPGNLDLVVLPGGFSYGDYLRSGALAAKARIMKSLRAYVEDGGMVIGICNGFQILTESGLLPGALLPNTNLRFLCKPCYLRVERNDTPFTTSYHEKEVVQFPIAHHEGLYYLPPDELDTLERSNRVIFRYADPVSGEAGQKHSPNGSLNGIAGIINKRGNVLGLMPHPERATLRGLIWGTDGKNMWHSIGEHFGSQGR